MTEDTAAGDALEALVARVAREDRVAFRALYDATAAKLFGLALRILQDRAAAEDAVQDAFIEIWRRAPTYDAGRGAVMAWMVVIVRNRAIDTLRRDGRNPAARSPVDIDEMAPLTAPEGVSGVEMMALMRCLAALDAEMQKLILLAYLEGRSREELATRVERPVNTVKTWLRRGLRSLRECLEA